MSNSGVPSSETIWEAGMRARVGIIDDHPAVMLGVASVLSAQHDLMVTATVTTADELLALDQQFDGILLDLTLADRSTPAENLRALGALNAPVLVYTSGDRPGLIREAARAGAAGMVRKSEFPDVIVEAVRGMIRGEVVASADWATVIDFDPDFVDAHLSPREAEVLGHYAAGETAERVASLLFISRQTVLDHITRIRAKYASANRSAPTKIDLYRRAVEDGLIPAGDDTAP
ncbi:MULTISPECIES: response regulator transcription factor [unclassified Microbacterium]|uniref:response regulator transcription factor n=2 Tax=unclassified Microbacterium TaxID=2609290 RepID=UPI0030167A50